MGGDRRRVDNEPFVDVTVSIRVGDRFAACRRSGLTEVVRGRFNCDVGEASVVLSKMTCGCCR